MARLKKNKDGYCSAWYNGKRLYGKTEAEAKRRRDEYRYNCEHGIENVEQMSVFDYVEQWLPVAKAGVATPTYNQYASYFDKLNSIVGEKMLNAVTPNDIKKVWNLYLNRSQSAINKASFLYKSMFQSAIENGYCRTNPVLAPSAKPHKGSRGTHRALEQWEIDLVESTPHRCRAAAMFMLKSGIRRGEALALRKSDIHDERIWVTKAVKFVNNRPVIGKTKNESSKRTVPLFEPLEAVLEDVTDYILPDADGEICSESAFQRAWESYMYTLSVKAKRKVDIRCHDLRHTFVTTCRDKGIDIKLVMAWCGHSSERMILEIYDHPTTNREQSAIAIMNGNRQKTDNSDDEDAENVVKSTGTGP
jgi:integrase